MSAVDLERALRAAGVACRVEARDRLAVLVVDTEAAATEDPLTTVRERRAWIARQARAHGFTHVALDIAESAPGADLPRA